MDLIPPQLIVSRHFSDEQAELDGLSGKFELASQTLNEFIEENATEEGLLASAMEDDKITRALAAARLRDAKRENCDPEEIDALTTLIALYDEEATARKRAKEASAALDAAAIARYGKLTIDQIQGLLINDKWGSEIARRIDMELGKLVQGLGDRIRTLGERYDETLGDIQSVASELNKRVLQHLAEMGVE
jgi:type I restriction enzyme M protein